MSGIIFLILRILLAVTLYLFLGLSLYILWRDMKEQREILAIQKEPSISLVVQEGDTNKTYQYKTNEIIIGRDPSCECTLNSEKVSANHARLSFHDNHWWIEDLKSTNGSFLNNERILVPTVVMVGDLLRFGDVTVTILILGSGPA
jgi:pSer/pThr/pTyr-binding forkhead associated (FHA) protein